jgi:hypothetical protein
MLLSIALATVKFGSHTAGERHHRSNPKTAQLRTLHGFPKTIMIAVTIQLQRQNVSGDDVNVELVQ